MGKQDFIGHYDFDWNADQYAQAIKSLQELMRRYDFASPEDEPSRYSGKITTRVSPHVHRQAAMLAAEQGVSLNQYINDAIVAMNNQLIGLKLAVPEMERVIQDYREKMERELAKTRSVTPSEQMERSWLDYYNRKRKEP